jgi:copper chaperone CopZ
MKIAAILMGLLLSFSVFASVRVEVDVPDIICGLCVEAIEKELSATQKVDYLRILLNDKKVFFSEIKGKRIPDSEIRSAIKKAGFDVAKIRRSS